MNQKSTQVAGLAKVLLAGLVLTVSASASTAFTIPHIAVPHVVIPHMAVPHMAVPHLPHSVPSLRTGPSVRAPNSGNAHPNAQAVTAPSNATPSNATPSISNLAGPTHVSPTVPNFAGTTHATPTLPNLSATTHVAPTVPSLPQPTHAAPSSAASIENSHPAPAVPVVTSTKSSQTLTKSQVTSRTSLQQEPLGCNPSTQEIAGCINVPPSTLNGPVNTATNSGGNSQFPGVSGMATPGNIYSTKPYYNSSGWRFNPANGLWQNPNDASQTLIPSIITCCDDTLLAFPGDAINPPPPDQVAKANAGPSGGCSLSPEQRQKIIAYMKTVPSAADRCQIAKNINATNGGHCVPSLRACLQAALDKPDDNNSTDLQDESDTTDAGNPPATESPPAEAAPSPTDNDDPYCNYMAQQIVRGELTPGGGNAIPPQCKATIAAAEAKRKANTAPPFSMNGSETDAEIRRLLQGLPQ